MSSGVIIEHIPEQEAEKAVSDAIAMRIGRFVVAWGSIENELEGYISTIFFIPPFQRAALSAGLAIDAKMRLIRTGIGQFVPYISKDNKKKYLKLLDDLRDLNHEARNFIFHWGIFVDAGSTLKAGKIKEGNNPRVEVTALSEEYFDVVLAEIALIRMRLRGALVELQAEISPMRDGWRARQAEEHARIERARRPARARS